MPDWNHEFTRTKRPRIHTNKNPFLEPSCAFVDSLILVLPLIHPLTRRLRLHNLRLTHRTIPDYNSLDFVIARTK
ncbi:MAG: hypothetical protein DMF73_06525 [Acidobacteria bacterium]|nr:MAG: hypothetical protein DMF73_06525 [Acidobacteriota bacterium]